jgi:hypothetical protein
MEIEIGTDADHSLDEWVAENTIHRIVSGSHLYGTARPDSDTDIRGVCLMPPAALIGLSPFEQYQRHNEQEDVEIYGLTKFVKLALDANPNLWDTLFAPPETWLLDREPWGYLYDIRHAFLSQKVKHTFSGYAYAQLKRLEGHRKWLLSPPDHQPTVTEFGGELRNTPKGGQYNWFYFRSQEDGYNSAMTTWNQYQTWLKERNPKRAAGERLVGYDLKHSGHLVRLLLKCHNILLTGDYNPILQPDELSQVQEVLHGTWSYERLITWTQEQDALIQATESSLPRTPDFHMVESVLMHINHWTLDKFDK